MLVRMLMRLEIRAPKARHFWSKRANTPARTVKRLATSGSETERRSGEIETRATSPIER
jgi:hypothetical protein